MITSTHTLLTQAGAALLTDSPSSNQGAAHASHVLAVPATARRFAARDSRLRPPLSPASPQPASRWVPLMSSSRSEGVGLFFPGLEGGGARRGQRGSAGWVSARQGARRRNRTGES